jgi:hypothetical protein
MVVLLVVVRLIWGTYESTQLQRELTRLRERGQPLAAEDFAYVPLADDQNAATLLMDAAKAFNSNAIPPRASNNVYPPYPPYNAKWMADAGASEAAHGKLFQLAREARSRPRAQWRDQPLAAPLIVTAVNANKLNAARNLANTLADSAEYQQLTGNDGEALERIRDVLHLSASLRQDDPVVAQLVSIGIEALAVDAVMQMAPGLHFENSPAARPAAKAIISQLLDDAPLRDGVRRSLVFERASVQDYRTTAARGTWVIRPLADAQIVRDHHNFDVLIDAASNLTSKPQVSLALSRMSDERLWMNASPAGARPAAYRDTPRYSRWFATEMSYDRYFETTFRVIGERRMAAVALAANLFRADHHRWPNALDELVPAYLPSIPLDPFADGEPIGYTIQRGVLPNGADRPLLFDRNGDKDMGPYPEPSYSWESNRWPGTPRRTEVRQYRDLERFNPPQPATAPSTQAVDDQP